MSAFERAIGRVVGAALVVSGLGWSTFALAQSCAPNETARTFSFTGASDSATVPAGFYSATVYLDGAQGGDGKSGTAGGGPSNPGGVGGLGATVSGRLTLLPGDVLTVGVGGRGSLTVNPGGANTSPAGGGDGGGATDIRLNGNFVAIAAGGGGGGSGGWSGGSTAVPGGAGGNSGASGSPGSDVPGTFGPFGAEGGTVAAGGAAGSGCSFAAGTAGLANGQGGTARNLSGSFAGAAYGGGGGGGATVGGGGGGGGAGTEQCTLNINSGGGGGAGGTSSTGSLTSASVTNGAVSGNGSALVCFAPDTQAPVVTAPANVTVANDAGQNGAIVAYPAATATDESGHAVTLTYTHPSGSSFPIGTTTVTVSGIDPAGNIASGSFTITVNDTEAPTLTTPSNITQATDAGQPTATIAFPPPVTADNSGVAPTVTFTPPAGSFAMGTTPVTVRSTDAAGNFTEATFSVTVNDTVAPTLTTPADIVQATDPGEPRATITYPVPTTADNSGQTPTVTFNPPAGNFAIGTTSVTVRSTDGAGNFTEAIFSVTVNDGEAPVMVAPANIVVTAAAGQNGANVSFVVATPTDNSGDDVDVVAVPASGSFFALGVTTVSITATDPSLNVATASFTVTVNDAEAPVIGNVPANIAAMANLGDSSVAVSWTAPTATDNDGIASFVSNFSPGDQFPIGVTTVTYTATDQAGNQSAASFTVTVTEDETPVIVSLPSDISQETDTGQIFATVTWIAPTATDNMPGVTLSSTHAPGDQFPVGVTNVSYTATDANSNTTTASFAITVIDAQPPVFTTFPSDIETDVDFPATGAVASWTEPTASDNLPGVTVTQTAGPASGSTFPLGVTTVSYEARDAAGSTVVDSFTVTVNQTAPGSVIFEFSGPSEGTYAVSSAEPDFNFSLNSSGGLVSRTVVIRPGSYAFAFTVPGGNGVDEASCTSGGAIDRAEMSGTLTVVSGGQITCSVSTLNSRDVATGMIGEFLQNRSALILENGPDVGRRLERLTGAYTNDGGASALGFGIETGQLPFNVTLSESDAKFSYSMRRSQAAGGEPRLIAGGLGALDKTDRLDRGEADTVLDERFGARPGEIPRAPLTDGTLGAPRTGSAAAAASTTAMPTGSGNTGTAEYGYGGDTGATIDPMQHRFDIWVEARMAAFSSKAGDGKFGIVHAGMDYLFTPSVLAGIGVQMDWTSQEGAAAGAEISGTGYMVGPYMTARLSDSFYLDARAAWGQSFNQISPFGTFEDEFDAQRWLVTAAVIGQYNLNEAWKVRPELRLSWFKETSDPYTDTLGVAIPSVSVETGTLEFGPTFTTEIQLGDGFAFAPTFAFEGIWTFHQENTATAVSSQPGLAEEGVRAKAEVGGTLTNGNGLSISGSLSYDGIGSDDYEAWGGKLRVGVTF